jgi:CRP-like cAMP-binding protein
VIFRSTFLFQQKRFPWLEEVANKYKDSLTAVKGMSFIAIQSQKKLDLYNEKLDKFNKRYPPGTVVCKQGDVGEEMYILVQGALKIEIDGNEIARIKEPGEVIGEMALLLGEPRTATMVSVGDTVLSIIKRKNLKEVAVQNKEFFFKMASTLSRREQDLFNLIENLNELIEQKSDQVQGPDIIIGNKYREDLKMLRDDLKQVYAKTDLDWVYDLALDVSEKMNKVREKYQESKKES